MNSLKMVRKKQKLLKSRYSERQEHPCVSCGYCCTVRACVHGEWSDKKKQCVYLTEDNLCEKYEQIVLRESLSPHPMMGCGCSSSLFNERREEKLRMTHRQRKEYDG